MSKTRIIISVDMPTAEVDMDQVAEVIGDLAKAKAAGECFDFHVDVAPVTDEEKSVEGL